MHRFTNLRKAFIIVIYHTHLVLDFTETLFPIR